MHKTTKLILTSLAAFPLLTACGNSSPNKEDAEKIFHTNNKYFTAKITDLRCSPEKNGNYSCFIAYKERISKEGTDFCSSIAKSNSESKISDISNSILQIEEDQKQSQSRVNNSENELKEYDPKINQKEDELKQLEENRLNSIQKYNDQIKQANDEIDKKAKAHNEKMGKNNLSAQDAGEAMNQYATQFGKLRGDEQKLESEKSNSIQKYDDKILDANREIETLKNKKTNTTDLINELKDRLDKNAEKIRDLKNDLEKETNNETANLNAIKNNIDKLLGDFTNENVHFDKVNGSWKTNAFSRKDSLNINHVCNTLQN